MKKLFPGYYRENYYQDKDTWKNGLIVFDSSFLLNLFRYSQETAQEILDALNKLHKRLWLPYQAAKEYHGNLYQVLAHEEKTFKQIITLLKIFLVHLKEYKRHPFLKQKIREQINELLSEIEVLLVDSKRPLKTSFQYSLLKESLAKVFENKVGPQASSSRLSEIYLEAEERLNKNLPPCYSSNGNKDMISPYSNLVLWKQLLQKTKNINLPVIFVAGGENLSWFYPMSEDTREGHPSLFEEASTYTRKPFLIISTPQFFEALHDKNIYRLPGTSLEEAILIEKYLIQWKPYSESTTRTSPKESKPFSQEELSLTLHPLQDKPAITSASKKVNPYHINTSLINKLNQMLKYYTSNQALYKKIADLFESDPNADSNIETDPYTED